MKTRGLNESSDAAVATKAGWTELWEEDSYSDGEGGG